MLTEKEIIEIIDRYINEKGLFEHFKQWLEAQGYSLTELGFKED